jgi:epoxyqueuosine reductase
MQGGADQLNKWMVMSEADWDLFTRGSPIRRAKRSGFLRNVAVALGNIGNAASLPALEHAVAHEDALVREHASWAIDRIGKRL